MVGATDPSALHTVLDYLCVRDPLEPADAIFVLGGASLAPITHAHRLYRQGYAPVVAFTAWGGTFGGQEMWGMPEARKFAELLRGWGVPESAILADEHSRNTLDEARSAVSFLRSRGVEVLSLILVAQPVHQRRAWATFARQNPGLGLVNAPPDEVETDEDTARRCVGEIERLERYGRQGDVVAQGIPEAIRAAVEALRNAL